MAAGITVGSSLAAVMKELANTQGGAKPADLRRIAAAAGQILLGGGHANADDNLTAAVASMFVLCAREKMTGTELGEMLKDDYLFSAEQASPIAEEYNTISERLFEILANHTDGGQIPQLKGMSWSLDCAVASDDQQTVNTAQFWLGLSTEKQQGKACDQNTVVFAASHSQILHLIGRLRDALKAIERSQAE